MKTDRYRASVMGAGVAGLWLCLAAGFGGLQAAPMPSEAMEGPGTRLAAAEKKSGESGSPSGRAEEPATTKAERQNRLCKALVACRTEFARCKNAIEHPDQSEQWSIAKEECGAHYQACIKKHFQSGEWFFTRWFWPFEIDCGS